MKKREEIGIYLDNLMMERRWHQKDLAARSGLSNAYISEIFRGGKNIGPQICGKIAYAFEKKHKLALPIYWRLNYLAAKKHGFVISEYTPSPLRK